MTIFSQCLDCKNYIGKNKEGKHTCMAFTDGIPDEVFWNKINHRERVDGDNGIIFENIE